MVRVLALMTLPLAAQHILHTTLAVHAYLHNRSVYYKACIISAIGRWHVTLLRKFCQARLLVAADA